LFFFHRIIGVYLVIFSIGTFPPVGNRQKSFVAVGSDEFNSLLVFLVFESVFGIEPVNQFTRDIVRAIGTGFKVFVAETAIFIGTFRFRKIARPIVVPQLAAFALALGQKYHAGFTIGATTTNFTNRHNLKI